MNYASFEILSNSELKLLNRGPDSEYSAIEYQRLMLACCQNPASRMSIASGNNKCAKCVHIRKDKNNIGRFYCLKSPFSSQKHFFKKECKKEWPACSFFKQRESSKGA